MDGVPFDNGSRLIEWPINIHYAVPSYHFSLRFSLVKDQ